MPISSSTSKSRFTFERKGKEFGGGGGGGAHDMPPTNDTIFVNESFRLTRIPYGMDYYPGSSGGGGGYGDVCANYINMCVVFYLWSSENIG